MFKIIGWIGSILFAICAAPQALKTFKDKNAHGSSLSYLLMWLGGELCMIVYVFPMKDYPLLFNYILNLFFLSIILYYKFFPNENYQWKIKRNNSLGKHKEDPMILKKVEEANNNLKNSIFPD